MQERQDFFRPPVDAEAIAQPRNSYTQPANGVRDLMDDRLMDAIHRVLEKIKEDNIPPPSPPVVVAEGSGSRMLNYEAARREEMIERSDLGLTLVEEQSLVERIAKKVEERISISLDMRIQKLIEGLYATGEYVLMPLGQDEKKIVEMDANHSGAKRKAVSPLDQVVNASGVPKKALNEDWSCAICQVTATSKHGLDEHFKGKKHKLNEAARRLKNERKNFENGISFNKKAKYEASYLCEAKQKSVSQPEQVANENTSTGVAVIAGEDWSCAICQFIATSKHAFDEHLQGKQHKSKETDLMLETVTKNQDKGLLRKEEANQRENDMKGCSRSKTIIEADQKRSKHGKRKTMISCEICRVGVTSEVAMELHRKGKNHLKMLKSVPVQNVNQIAHTVVDANLDTECKYDNSLKLDDTDRVVGVKDVDAECRYDNSLKLNDDDGVVGVKDVDAECRYDNSLKFDDADGVVGVKDVDANLDAEYRYDHSLKLDDTDGVVGGKDVDAECRYDNSLKLDDADGVMGVKDVDANLDAEYRYDHSLKLDDTDGVVGVKDVDANLDAECRYDNSLKLDDTDGVVGMKDVDANLELDDTDGVVGVKDVDDAECDNSLKLDDTDGMVGVKDVDANLNAECRYDNSLKLDDTDGMVGVKDVDANLDAEGG